MSFVTSHMSISVDGSWQDPTKALTTHSASMG